MSKLVLFPSLESMTRSPEQMAIINLLDRLDAQEKQIADLIRRVRDLERHEEHRRRTKT